jgi:hypothetical protein
MIELDDSLRRTLFKSPSVATMLEDYESRLKEMFPGRFKKLKILAADRYDLVLSKLERNSPKVQGDVEYLRRPERRSRQCGR